MNWIGNVANGNRYLCFFLSGQPCLPHASLMGLDHQKTLIQMVKNAMNLAFWVSGKRFSFSSVYYPFHKQAQFSCSGYHLIKPAAENLSGLWMHLSYCLVLYQDLLFLLLWYKAIVPCSEKGRRCPPLCET